MSSFSIACTVPLDAACERRLLWLLAAIQFAHIVDFMIMMPLGPILMRAFSLDARQFGLLAMGATLAAAWLAGRIRLHAVPPEPT